MIELIIKNWESILAVIAFLLVLYVVIKSTINNKKEELSSESDNDREIPIGGGGSTPDNE